MADRDKSLAERGALPSSLANEPLAIRPSAPAHANQALKDLSLRVGSIFTLIAIWWILSFFFPPTLVPRPLDTFAEVKAIVASGNFFGEMASTLRRVLVGFGIA
ncbi:MAG TPA: hypothetical protein VE131_05230, partial [Terriglobales bacterium]|nr:hypothetical protein [Terriglobales bacterium]